MLTAAASRCQCVCRRGTRLPPPGPAPRWVPTGALMCPRRGLSQGTAPSLHSDGRWQALPWPGSVAPDPLQGATSISAGAALRGSALHCLRGSQHPHIEHVYGKHKSPESSQGQELHGRTPAQDWGELLPSQALSTRSFPLSERLSQDPHPAAHRPSCYSGCPLDKPLLLLS